MRNLSFLITLFIHAAFLPISTEAGQALKTKSTGSPDTLTASASWEAEWNRIMAEAKKEGELLITMGPGFASSHRQEIIKEIQAKYGITINSIIGTGSENARRLIQEATSGIDATDLLISGSTTMSAVLKPAGILQPIDPLLILPDVVNAKTWFEGKVPFADKDKMILTFSAYIQSGLSYHAEYISKEELASYKDLLSPKLKGKIIMSDPTVGGAGSQWTSTIGIRVMGVDWLRQFAKQDITVTRDLDMLVQSVIRGKYYVAIGAGGLWINAQNAGVKVYEYSPKEGGFLTGGFGSVVALKKSRHPNAQKVFLNWLCTKDGQTLFSKAVKQQSARIDVPTAFLNPWEMRQPGVKVFDARSEEYNLGSLKDEALKKELFGAR